MNSPLCSLAFVSSRINFFQITTGVDFAAIRKAISQYDAWVNGLSWRQYDSHKPRKTLFFGHVKLLCRKGSGKRRVGSEVFETLWGRKRILEVYVNIDGFWGPRHFGVEPLVTFDSSIGQANSP